MLNNLDYYEHNIIVELMETDKLSDIFDGFMYLNYTYIKEDIDLSELTMLNYSELKNTKFYQEALLKINKKCPSDFFSYYLISEMLNKNGEHMFNISQHNEDACENKKANENVSIEHVSKSQAFNIPITLLKINQSQFLGEDVLPNGSLAKFKMVFANDVHSLYLQFNCNNDKTVLNSKWFDFLKICVNGENVFEYTYEMLCLYNQNNDYKLPNGVLAIPNVIKYINWKNSEIALMLTNIKHHQDASTTVSIFAESDNYMVCGFQTKLFFKSSLY